VLTGVLYFVSCTVNPILYNVMSRRFRQAFVETICGRHDTRGWHAHYANQSQLAAVRRARRSVGTEMLPSPHHHQHQQQQHQPQQQLPTNNVYVDMAGKTTVHQ